MTPTQHLRIPEPGDIYERHDGELVLVTGLVIDCDGTFCVEYELSGCDPSNDPAANFENVGLGEWLGVVREAGSPAPRCFTLALATSDPGDAKKGAEMRDVLAKALAGGVEAPTVPGSDQ